MEGSDRFTLHGRDAASVTAPASGTSRSVVAAAVAGESDVSSGSVAGESSVVRHFLLLGVCGSGMRSLAEILIAQGHLVTGTDSLLRPHGGDGGHVYPIHPAVRIMDWDSAARALAQAQRPPAVPAAVAQDSTLPARHIDVVVASTAVPEHDERLLNAVRAGLPVRWLPQQVAECFRGYHQVCVAGTHGKSTTTSLLYWIVRSAGLRTGVFVGGRMLNTEHSGAAGFTPAASGAGSGCEPVAIVESCEYRGAFLNFSPRTAVLTGIERDHVDCYPTPQSEDQAFLQFARKLPLDGRLVVSADCSRALRLACQLSTEVVTFGVDADADWTARRVSPDGPGTTFDLIGPGNLCCRTSIRLPGVHNVRNVLAAVAAAASLGIDLSRMIPAVESFSGIQRRFEQRGDWKGMTLIDDYAHHPGAIEATLQAAGGAYPGRRLVAVCEPHQLSRTNALFSGLCAALLQADEVLLLPVLAARETASRGECLRASGRIVRNINLQGGRAFLMADLDQVTARLDHSGRPGDVIITMGAGRTYELHDEFNRRLQRDRAA